jgi:hypothetical protein
MAAKEALKREDAKVRDGEATIVVTRAACAPSSWRQSRKIILQLYIDVIPYRASI